MDDLDNILEQSVMNDIYNSDNDGQQEDTNKKDDNDILGLDKEVKLKTRRKLVTLNDQKLLSKDGLQYLYDHRKKMKYLHHNKSNYNSKDYTTHYTYKNLSTILEFYQLWAHKLFPKLRFGDAIMLANRKVSGESRSAKYFRERLIEKEINELFPDDAIDISLKQHGDDIDVTVLSDTEMGNKENEQPSVVPQNTNGFFVGDDDDEDDDLYTTSKSVDVAATNNDSFPEDDDDEEEMIHLANRRNNGSAKVVEEEEEEFPEANDIEQYDEEMEVMREMGM